MKIWPITSCVQASRSSLTGSLFFIAAGGLVGTTTLVASFFAIDELEAGTCRAGAGNGFSFGCGEELVEGTEEEGAGEDVAD